jgi:hypothetical protein
MRFFDFGTAPAAKALGYQMVSVVQSTPEELSVQHAGEDLIFVYGAEFNSEPGKFEFARFEPVAQPAAVAPPASERLFMGVYPCGIVYSDRSREESGDYVKLAFLPYDTLNLELRPGVPDDLRALIEADASKMASKSGQQYQISSSGQTVLLGSKLASALS